MMQSPRQDGETHGDVTTELSKLEPSTLYLTFNAPEVNEYHHGLFATTSPPTSTAAPSALLGGTLFHAVYNHECRKWGFEKRTVINMSTSKKLVLLWRVGKIRISEVVAMELNLAGNFDGVADAIDAVLEKVEFEVPSGEGDAGTAARKGNPELGGYDCVLWTEDALMALNEKGVIGVEKPVAQIMKEGRSAAGPKDARVMVGINFGGVRVVNKTDTGDAYGLPGFMT